MNKFYPGEPVHVHIQSFINIILLFNYTGEKLGNYKQKRVRVNCHYFVVMDNR